jgi:hypothetical protein
MTPDDREAIAHALRRVDERQYLDFYGRDALVQIESGLDVTDRQLSAALDALAVFRVTYPHWASVIEAIALIGDEQILRNEDREQQRRSRHG